MISYVTAVLAAAADATSNVLNRKAAREEPEALQFRLRLLLDLVHRPVWLAAVGVMIVSFVLAAGRAITPRPCRTRPDRSPAAGCARSWQTQRDRTERDFEVMREVMREVIGTIRAQRNPEPDPVGATRNGGTG